MQHLRQNDKGRCTEHDNDAYKYQNDDQRCVTLRRRCGWSRHLVRTAHRSLPEPAHEAERKSEQIMLRCPGTVKPYQARYVLARAALSRFSLLFAPKSLSEKADGNNPSANEPVSPLCNFASLTSNYVIGRKLCLRAKHPAQIGFLAPRSAWEALHFWCFSFAEASARPSYRSSSSLLLFCAHDTSDYSQEFSARSERADCLRFFSFNRMARSVLAITSRSRTWGCCCSLA
jgi:hypothetical protein